MSKRFILGVLAYLVPSFIVAFFWHLQIFAGYYADLKIYREQMIVPFGFGSMLLQGVVFSLVYARLWAGEGIVRGGAKFAAGAGVLAWSYTVLPVAAKFPMASVSGFMAIETAFTIVQFAVVGPVLAAVYKAAEPRTAPAFT